MQEIYGTFVATVSPAQINPLFIEPYIPPMVSAVMVTAQAGGSTSAATTIYSGASCHSVVFPKTDRRLYVEFANLGQISIFLINDADLMATSGITGGQIALSLCEQALILQPASSTLAAQNALVYSRNASQYISAVPNETRPFLNGVIAGANPPGTNGVMDSNSIIDPKLRATGSLSHTRTNPGNLFFPAKSVQGTNGIYATPGSGRFSPFGAVLNQSSVPYVRLEYLV
jgi:hypothetical protein